MKHARSDYDAIQDPRGLIPDDEPVFLIRGQDPSAPATLRYWAIQNEKRDGDERLTRAALRHARAMEKWYKAVDSHRALPKRADAPDGAARE